MMLSYVYFGTNDLECAVRFYDATLAPLGMPRCVTGDPDWDLIFMPRRSPMAEVLTVLPVFDCTMAQISTRLMCEIRMGIKWPRFAVALQKDSNGISMVSMRPWMT
jgi:hypothetical protein